ncbi:XRE family transcriptional regulator [Actinomadura craniellae]|uniref:XRE family transcriptional regulator n=1 Tax=Actinomadura craniellae TaxID=2231787 RepID=A0A365H8D1_9ACTN|nr:XRE family transcriptional regulator [Actinomadura craniellae]RAY15216.1 XRE family transcriptional regulator [Actinomadura craniellae]
MDSPEKTPTTVRLKVLLRERHWQTHRTFTAEYDKAARKIDPVLVGAGPSRAQLHRWTSGELKGLPYPDHCRVLEKMFPGWTAAQLFEPAAEEEEGQAAEPGPEPPAPAEATRRAPADPAAGTWGDSIRGHIVELSIRLDIDIAPDGWARLVNRHELLNLSDTPLTRVSRELWFENTRGPLAITPTDDCERRMMIRRLHDTANLAKFACQISPPLQPGESAVLAFSCEDGQFVDDHYWRQGISRHVRQFTMRVRQRGAGHLLNCSAIEEHPDGAEHSADAGLIWDYEDGDAVITLTREYLRPNQAITLRWDVPR